MSVNRYVLPAGKEARARVVAQINADMAALPDDKLHSVEIREETRSLAQNRYWHGLVVPLICRHTLEREGLLCLPEAMHVWLRERFVAPRHAVIAGDEVQMRSSTADMTKREFAEMIEAVAYWCAEDLDLVIPPPDWNWQQYRGATA